ncbi:MAG: hypothetical protein SFX73_06750 [Kofleriaceae bacterium]|nr:hypothetical protein [Kofleriaceae bacterium]
MSRVLLVMLLGGCGRLAFDLGAAEDEDLLELSIRGHHACIREGGTISCWGKNHTGQLGRGTTSPFEGPANAFEGAQRVFTGENSTFSVDIDGRLWGWGDNRLGQLGLGTTTNAESEPRMVMLDRDVVEVGAGELHTCAVTEDGEVYCWGDNTCGKLGDGTNTSRPYPQRVAGLPRIVGVEVNDLLTCAIDTTGQVWCFGAPSNAPAPCSGGELVPVAIPELAGARALGGGCHLSMCAIDSGGTPRCWGENVAGVLGSLNSTEARPAPVRGLARAEKIATGFISSCAAGDDRFYCWGANGMGQLGIDMPAITQSNDAVEVTALAGMEIDDIEVGCTTTCIRSGADVYCWGGNEDGELADGTQLPEFAPRLVLTLMP